MTMFSISGGALTYAFFACVLVGAAQAQPAPPPRSVQPVPLTDRAGAPEPLRPDSRFGSGSIEGEVVAYLMNPYGEIDGLRLAEGRVVKFPPHMGEALTTQVQIGQRIRAIGRSEAGDSVAAQTIVNLSSGTTLVEQPPEARLGLSMPRHLRAASLTSLQTEGRIELVLTGPRGEANGVVLDNGAIVRFPPHMVNTPLQTGQPFAAQGLGTRNARGMALEALSIGTTLSALLPLDGAAR